MRSPCNAMTLFPASRCQHGVTEIICGPGAHFQAWEATWGAGGGGGRAATHTHTLRTRTEHRTHSSHESTLHRTKRPPQATRTSRLPTPPHECTADELSACETPMKGAWMAPPTWHPVPGPVATKPHRNGTPKRQAYLHAQRLSSVKRLGKSQIISCPPTTAIAFSQPGFRNQIRRRNRGTHEAGKARATSMHI